MAKKTGFSIMSALNAQSLVGDAHAANEFIVEDIPLEQIEPNTENFYSTENIETLAADIKQNGLMHNVVVCERGANGLYKLISGERRYRAFVLLKQQGNEGYETIPATVDSEQNPLLIKLKLISANASARVLSDYEKSEQAAQIEAIAAQLKQEGVPLPGRVREITAQALGVSTAQAGRLTRIANDLVPEVKEMFAAGDIGVTTAYEVAALPPEQQVQEVEARAAKQAEPKPKQADTAQEPKPPKAAPEEIKRERAATWWAEFDGELSAAASTLENWNYASPHKQEYELIKTFILREAAMRKKRAE
jgi:ParB family transcriptional regulator, chromosome partitioning protein